MITIARESVFQKQVINYLKTQNVWFRKEWAGGKYGAKEGTPDIVACINGEFHGIELKSDGTSYNETKLQAMNLDHINRAGGVGYVLRPTKTPDIKWHEFDYFCMNFEQWKQRWFE